MALPASRRSACRGRNLVRLLLASAAGILDGRVGQELGIPAYGPVTSHLLEIGPGLVSVKKLHHQAGSRIFG